MAIGDTPKLQPWSVLASALNIHLGCTQSIATKVETKTTCPIIVRERVCCQRWSVWGRRRSIGSGRPQTPSPQPTRPRKPSLSIRHIRLDAGCAKCNKLKIFTMPLPSLLAKTRELGKRWVSHMNIYGLFIYIKESLDSADTCASVFSCLSKSRLTFSGTKLWEKQQEALHARLFNYI